MKTLESFLSLEPLRFEFLMPLLDKHSPFAALIINHAEDLCTGKNFFVSNLIRVIQKLSCSQILRHTQINQSSVNDPIIELGFVRVGRDVEPVV